MHTATASQVFAVDAEEIDPGMRSKAKMINYGIVYGLSDYGLADRLNIPREEAKEFIDAYLERFPRVAAFMAETIERAKEEGYVTTLWGRRRQIPELQRAQLPGAHARRAPRRQHGDPGHGRRHHQARDGAHARGARRVAAWRRELLLTIHDELLFEGPPEEAGRRARADRARDVRACGSTSRRWRVDIGVGRNWLEAK